MTVKKLFQIADPEIIFYAYLMIEPPFDDFLEYDVQAKAGGIREIRGRLNQKIKLILESKDIIEDVDPCTIFVMDRTSTEFGKGYIKHIEAFLVKDEEAFSKYYKNFTIWNDAGECRIEHYAFDFETPDIIAKYSIADESIKHMGIEACCAAILNEICFWRERTSSEKLDVDNKEDLFIALDEAIKDIESQKVFEVDNIDELMEELNDDFEWEWTEEDQEYRKLYMAFKKSVKNLEMKHSERVGEEDHQRYIAAIRNEYQKRYSG